jgi:hypothetical protein
VLSWEAAITVEDNIDEVLGILISLGPRLASLLVILVLPLFVLIKERCIERLAEADALEECVLGLWVHGHCLCKIFSN